MGDKSMSLFPSSEIKEEDFEKYKRARGLYIEDPWERVKVIFSSTDYQLLHPELQRAFHIFQVGLVLGSGFGGIKESAFTQKEFVRTNDANIYLSKNEMYRKMTDKAIIGFGRGALKWGPRIGFFTGGFSLFASCCEAYRNKSGIIEYVVGGYFAGGISRSFLGMKGFVAGGIIGAVMGFFCGAFRVGIEKLTKTDTLTLKYSQYALIQHRKQLNANFNFTAPQDKKDLLMASVYGPHKENPLNYLDDSEENKEKIEKNEATEKEEVAKNKEVTEKKETT